MLGIGTMLAAAVITCLTSVAPAEATTLGKPRIGGATGFATRTPVGPTQGFVTPGEVETLAPICNADRTACMCRNEGSAKDFMLCGWDLVHHCESNAGCIWAQYPSGDVLCVCNVPLP